MRLVYAPAAGIGNFGGETDNWRWPRHTGDWSFFRAYVGKDGKPAPLREGQRALQADALAAGVGRGRQGGRPRLRGRLPGPHAAAPDLRRGEGDDRVDASRARSRPAQEQIAILEALGEDEQGARRSRPRRGVRGLNNGLTNRKGVLEGLVKGGILAQKEQQREGARGLDRRRPRAAEEVRRRAAGARRAAGRGREDARARRRARPARLRRPRISAAAQTALPSSRSSRPKTDMDREAELPGAQLDAHPRGPGAAQRTLDPRLDRALLALGDGPRRGAARRPADRPPRQARGPHAGHGEGRRREGDRRLPRRALRGHEDGATRTSASACSTRRTAELAATEGLVHRPRARARPARPSRTARRRRTGRAPCAAAAALHAGAAREGGRPRGARREQHAARDLRHR